MPNTRYFDRILYEEQIERDRLIKINNRIAAKRVLKRFIKKSGWTFEDQEEIRQALGLENDPEQGGSEAVPEHLDVASPAPVDSTERSVPDMWGRKRSRRRASAKVHVGDEDGEDLVTSTGDP